MCKMKTLYILILIIHLSSEDEGDRPVIKASNGDLILEPANNKNVYLRTRGEMSKIYVNDMDLTRALQGNLTRYDDKITSDVSSVDFMSYLRGPEGILTRLRTLENKPAGNDTGSVNAFLRRRINAINRQITSILLRLETIVNQNDCNSGPCKNGGTCQRLVTGYFCQCPNNWQGTDCDVDVNECRNFAGTDIGCQNGATCINRQGYYECLCASGWFGVHCTRRAKDCTGGNFEMCGHGTCLPITTGAGIMCMCDQGWTKNGTDLPCTNDVDECKEFTGVHCSVNPKVECINLPGSFKCGVCPTGYEGDGYRCSDIDECATNNGGCSKTPHVSCHNTIGSRICGACPPGYQGDGVTCTWRGSCSYNHGGCHPSAKCIENLAISAAFVQCICPRGMMGDGVGIGGCYIPITNTNATNCINNPCGSHGQCTQLDQGITCICEEGYTGARCDQIQDYCSENPCKNGGVCRVDNTTTNGFRCECTALYSGDTCQNHARTCGGVLDSQEGNIMYPLINTTKKYSHNSRCAWVIETVPNKVINVTFNMFNLEASPGCIYDFLQIHDGRSSASQLIGRFCGNTLPKGGTIISSNNHLYFWFRSDQSINREGFSLHWSTIYPVCGGRVNAKVHGSISSPGSPGNYPPNRDCYWHISTDLGKRIQLHFFRIGLEAHANCSFDYLEIFDGDHSTDPLIKRYCNTTQPGPLQSAGSEMLIHFHSDAYNSGEGFQITYAPIEGVPGCGGLFTQENGEITSPSYNGQYLHDLLCDYKIQVPPDTKIQFKVVSFQLERSHRCRFDHLTIHDGPDTDSKLVGKFCGTNAPKNFVSSSNTIFMQFKTDHTGARGGFRITYETLCVNNIVGESGTVKSPGYPNNYPSNRICEYYIITTPGKAIKLTFLHFDIEDNKYFNCKYDNLEIRDGHNSNSTLLGRYCDENIPPVQMSTHNYMYLKFSSDFSLSGTGFLANFTTYDVACGGIYTDSTGLINFPGGNDLYENKQTCTWILQAPIDHKIQITWNRFDIEDLTASCLGDYVSITELGSDVNDSELSYGKFCGSKLPPAITTVFNRLKIYFQSDDSIRHAGFSLSYTYLDGKSFCGGNYLATHGYIYSPGWPNYYQRSKDCIWTIVVPNGQQIILNITIFSLELSYSRNMCTEDYLEIRNGPAENSPLVGKFCGTAIPKRIPSTGNSLYLHFHSDSYIEDSGFKIEWDGTTTGCGGTLTSISGVITSPNYPQLYDDSAECFWRIVTSVGSTIDLTFTEIDLESNTNCVADYVEIFDGHDASSDSFGRFCGTLNNKFIKSKSNQVFIKFRSDISVGGKGFSLNYNTNCNTVITGSSGVIESPNFPYDYPTNLNCLWTIKVPKGNTINATFTHFDLLRSLFPIERSRIFRHPYGNQYYSSSFHRTTTYEMCRSDYLQLKNGKDADFGLKYCGTTLPQKYISHDNNVNIKFVTGPYMTRTGFRLEWIADGCGGTIRKEYGTIGPPSHRRGFEDPTECEWLIETPTGTSVQFYIFSLNMRESPNCTIDAIEIYNGVNALAPLLMKVCHREHMQYQATSTSNFMFVRYVSTSGYAALDFHAHFGNIKSTCGGTFEGREGSFTSPNYPRNYGDLMNCVYKIKVPRHHKVQLDITDLDLFIYPNDFTLKACGDKINVYDGNDISRSNYSIQYCGTSRNVTTYISKSHEISVEFISDAVGHSKGFKANFSVTCGANILAEGEGILSKESSTVTHKNCTWTIISINPQQKITLTFTHMALWKLSDFVVTNRHCQSDFLKVFDGIDDEAPLRGEYCGRKVPPAIVSRGNAITVMLGSYTSSITGEFSAHYTVLDTACGGTLTSEEGTFTSPNYPESYPMNVDCVWTLKASPGNKVSLNFEMFDMQISTNCNEDYVEVREINGGGKLLGVFCGNDIPVNVTVSAQLYIKFHSDNSGSSAGFIAHYGIIHGNEITGKSQGIIASPLYPKRYVGAADFSWRITTNTSTYISLTIIALEIDVRGRDCYNYLGIYDGYDETAPVLKIMCGLKNSLDNEVRTTSNMAYIKLFLDETNERSLFSLMWLEAKNDENGIVYSEESNCGSNNTVMVPYAGSVDIKSPNYPKNYEDNLDCVWIFQTVPGRHLSVQFTDFHIEESDECFMDYVKVYTGVDGTNNWNNVTDNLCLTSSVRRSIETTNLMKVNFHTDVYGTKTGFKGTVSSVCGGVLTDFSGVITITDTDNSKNRFKIFNCTWIVKVRPRRTIKAYFSRFNIPSDSSGTCTNYVSLRNGDSIESPILGSNKYCGVTFPSLSSASLETSGNTLFVSYYNQAVLSNNGFTLRYEEKTIECGSNSKLDFFQPWKVIHSLNYDEPPLPFSECVWTIMGPSGDVLRFDFIDKIDLYGTEGGECKREYVEIRDGGSENSPLIGKYCDAHINTIKTTGNLIYVKFVTTLAQPNDGFKANISIDVCGATVWSTSGEITSPGYPKYPSLPIGTICEWRIKGLQGHSLWINPVDISLPESESYCTIKVVIEDAMPTNESQIAHYCNGYHNLQAVRSYSNEVLIKFYIQKPTSDIDTSYYKGFKISYNSTGSICGGTLRSPSGIIESPGYPKGTSARYCRWNIELPNENRRVRLEFDNVDFANSGIVVALYNDPGFKVPIISLPGFRDSITGTVYRSSGNTMTLYMWARSLQRGFRARFTSDEPAVCGGTLYDQSGVIQSPLGLNNQSYYCSWRIIGSRSTPVSNIYSDSTISDSWGVRRIPDKYPLTITKSSGYHNTTIYVKVSMNTSASSSAHYCRQTPKLAISPYPNDLFMFERDICNNMGDIVRSPYPNIQIHAYQTKNREMDFKIEWKIQPCGGRITISDENVEMLNLPSAYNGSLDCAWLVSIRTRRDVELSLEGSFSSACSEEFVKISYSSMRDATVIAEYCQSNLPSSPLKVNFRQFFVEYHADSFNSANSLFLKANVGTSNTCGGILTSAENVFMTPNFPKAYKENQECTWEIAAALGNRVSLMFEQRFSIEDTANCTKDFVAVFDWQNSGYRQVARLCGRNIPNPINSTINRLKVLFRSDGGINLDGFKARWTSICGGEFEATDVEQFLYSPDYPLYYPNNVDCEYKIKATDQKVLIKFMDFYLEDHYGRTCDNDNVTISGLGEWAESEIFCGVDTPQERSISDGVKIRLRTDSTVQRRGFKVMYKIKTCGGNITQHSVITSGDNGSYEDNLNCIWNITAPANKNVVVRFAHFDLENNGGCGMDFVAVYNGNTIDEDHRLALLCGHQNTSLPIFKSEGSSMVVQFVTDVSFSLNGFRAEVYFSYGESVGCGGIVDLTSGSEKILNSPIIGGAYVYEKFLQCHWHIHAATDKVINIEFTRFNIAPCQNMNQTALGYSNCTCDSVQVRDGANPTSSIIGTYCGYNIPPKMFSSFSNMFLILTTDGETESSGFEAKLTVRNSQCGSQHFIATDSIQHIKSPNYDGGSVPRGLHCTYNIKEKDDKQLHIKIASLDLAPASPDSNECIQDRLVVAESLIKRNETLGTNLVLDDSSIFHDYAAEYLMDITNIGNVYTFCGQMKTMDLYLMDIASIRLYTSADDTKSYKGFDIEVSNNNDCERIFTGTQGRIQSSVNTKSSDCYTYIEAPANHTVSVYFFQVTSYFENEEYVDILDGKSRDAKQITRITGDITQPQAAFSSGRYMTIHRHENDYYPIKYDLNYMTTDKGPGCGGSMFSYFGVITSPLYPNPYRRVSSCEFELETMARTKLTLRFKTFDLGSRSTCEQVYVQLVDRSGKVFATYCSDDEPADYKSPDNYVKIVYTTTMNTGGEGWVAQFIGLRQP